MSNTASSYGQFTDRRFADKAENKDEDNAAAEE